jgi:hypothetical protein
VLWRAAWRAARSGEKGGEEGALMKRRRFNDDERGSSYVHALFNLKKVDGFVYGRVPEVCCSDEVAKRAESLGG